MDVKDVSNELKNMGDVELRDALNDSDFLKDAIICIVKALRKPIAKPEPVEAPVVSAKKAKK